MSKMVSLIIIVSIACLTQSYPIHNGFRIRFSPIFAKEDLKPRKFGTLYAKIPQSPTLQAAALRRTMLNQFLPPLHDLGKGCSNQVTKVAHPFKDYLRNYNDLETWDKSQYYDIPVFDQPFQNYQLLVVTAPSHMKIKGKEDDPPLIVYIVFPDEETSGAESGTLNIPTVYFVNRPMKVSAHKRDVSDNIYVVNNSRIVPPLNSKKVPKFIKFKNKVADHYI